MDLRQRRGLTLVEVMIAILVFAIGALGLAATCAAVVRQLASSSQRSRSAHLAATRDEKIHAIPCAAASGSEITPGIIDNWAVAIAASRMLVDQTVQRRDSKGLHVETFRSAAPCD